MSINVSGRHEMPAFIQSMYGFVIAFAAIKFTSDFDNHIGESFGSLAFLLFTLAMIAHDWYTFHILKNSVSGKFATYIPQILSLFFLAQMTLTAATVKFGSAVPADDAGSAAHDKVWYWFLYGFCYTLCNILHSKSLLKSSIKRSLIAKYVLHILLCIGFGILNFYFQESFKVQAISLIASAFVIIGLWVCTDKRFEKLTFTLPNSQFPIIITIPATEMFSLSDGFTIQGFPLTSNIEKFKRKLDEGNSAKEKDELRKEALSILFSTTEAN